MPELNNPEKMSHKVVSNLLYYQVSPDNDDDDDDNDNDDEDGDADEDDSFVSTKGRFPTLALKAKEPLTFIAHLN